MPVQPAVVDDVLARGQPRVQAARVAEHAHARPRRERVARRVDAVDRRCPRRADAAPATMRSVVVLPAPLGPSSAGDAAVGGAERRDARRTGLAPPAEALRERRRPRSSCRAPTGSGRARSGRGMPAEARARRRFGARRLSMKPRRARRAAAQAHAVAGVGHHHVARLRAGACATRSPWRGGVAGSMPPDSTSAGPPASPARSNAAGTSPRGQSAQARR